MVGRVRVGYSSFIQVLKNFKKFKIKNFKKNKKLKFLEKPCLSNN
jgi:hypothetical protein